MTVSPESLQAVLGQIEKVYGERSIHYASDQPPIARIPTGSYLIDYATAGGIPIGRWSHFYGNYGSFKTHLALKTIASAQNMGMTCALYNVEKRFNENWARQLGVNTNNLLIVEGTEIEILATKMEALLEHVDMHVVDSIAASVSLDELAGKVEDWTRAMGARVWGKVIRRINNKFDDTKNTIILINQVRSNMQYGGGEDPPGGKAINFESAMSLRFRKGTWLYKDKNGHLTPDGTNKDTVTGDTEPDGHECQIRVEKNTVSVPDRTARVRIDKRTGEFDLTWELIRLGIHLGVFERAGSWYSMNGKKVQGENGLREWIDSDASLRNAIAEKIANES